MFYCKLGNPDVNIIIVKITINQVNVLLVDCIIANFCSQTGVDFF